MPEAITFQCPLSTVVMAGDGDAWVYEVNCCAPMICVLTPRERCQGDSSHSRKWLPA